MKRCKACGAEKDFQAFWPEPRNKDGLFTKCKDCLNTLRREQLRAAPPDAREKLLSGKRDYYERVKSTPEYQAKQKATRDANRAAKREYDRKRHEQNKGKNILRVTEWTKRNPDKRRVIVFGYDARRRQRKVGGSTTKEVRAWIDGQSKICYWCNAKCPENFHVDHYYPLAKGGAHTVSNLVISCPKCNCRKNAKDPYRFAAEAGRLF